MPSIPLTTQDPGEFAYTDGQTFYNEKLAHEILKHAAAMADEGYEIVFDMLNETQWDLQSSTLTNQSSIISALAGEEDMPAAWSSRLSNISSILSSLLSLTMDSANFSVRETMMTLIESVIASAGNQLANPEGEEDLVEVFKAAFLEETVPGSGVYLSTVLEQLKEMLQAIQDLKYNEEILEIPATPRPIRIHLQSKTIQQ